VEIDVERSLSALGVAAKPKVFVVGVETDQAEAEVSIEQAPHGPLAQDHFVRIHDRAAELYQQDPDSRKRYSHPGSHDRKHREFRMRAYGRAILEVLSAVVGDESLRHFISQATKMNGYSVFVVVALPDKLLAEAPQLAPAEFIEQYNLPQSLLQGVVGEILKRASVELYQPDAGIGLNELNTADVLASAARGLIASVTGIVGDPRSDLFDRLNQLATTRYEQRVGVGSILLVRPGCEVVRRKITLRTPVRMSETRACRKLLEISSDKGQSLLVDGFEVYGLGQWAELEPFAEASDIFEVRVIGPGEWTLRCMGTDLMTVEFGAPRIPERPVDRGRFEGVCARVLGLYDGAALWALTESAAEAAHGTMLVVSQAAAAEAARLESQSTAIEPTLLDDDLVRQLTAIDGAILVDPQGVCHSIGVILDGIATSDGDRSRGARYNSAVKYLASASAPTVVVIVSEDGMINVLPRLHPKMARLQRDSMVAALREAATHVPADGESFYSVYDEIKANQFYFSAEQISEINELVAEHWERRMAEGAGIFVYEAALVVDPKMNDSYLTD
jgi:hypothetical protein